MQSVVHVSHYYGYELLQQIYTLNYMNKIMVMHVPSLRPIQKINKCKGTISKNKRML